MSTHIEEEICLQAGEELDNRFVILGELGRGAMGVVYKASQKGVQRPVAVKMLHEAKAAEPEAMARFQREAQVIATLDHAGIVKVYATGMAGKQPFFVMEYLEGTTLYDLIEERQADCQRYLEIFIQSAQALHHAHGKGIVHRDVKPRNIMLVQVEGQEVVKLVDFGIARLRTPETGAEIQKLTKTGVLIGSPLYMSPEQCLARGLDARSDIYSLGCVMFEAVTGEPLFKDVTATRILYKHLSEPPPAFKDLKLKMAVPPSLEAVIRRALAKQPGDRYQTAAELAHDLAELKSGKPASHALAAATSSTKTLPIIATKRSTRGKLLLIGVSVALLSGLAIAFSVHKPPAAINTSAREAEATADKLSEAAIRMRWVHRHHTEDAAALYRQAYDLYVSAGQEKRAGSTAFQLGSMLAHRDKEADAAPWLDKALNIYSKVLSKDDRDLMEVRAERAMNLVSLRRFKEAENDLQSSIEFYRHQRNLDKRWFFPLVECYADACEKANDLDRAEAAFQDLILLQKENGSDGEVIAYNILRYAKVLKKNGKADLARQQEELATKLKNES